MKVTPKTGLKGLFENWQSDILAAISVSLVALPLGLGIAVASGVPPISGIFSAIIGGVVAIFFRGSHLGIKGPTAGLIAVVLASLVALDDGTGQSLNYVLAAVVVSGGLQVLLGLLKMGRFAEVFHSAVIHGILAAIGIIIFAKQIHIAMGTTPNADNIVGTIIDAFRQVGNINPFVGIISLTGLLLLVFHSKISYKLFHFIPAPMWVLVLSIPFVYAFDFFQTHSWHLFGREYHVGPELLIQIPDNILDAIAHPNFSKIDTLPFWSSVISITMIATIESLAASKAVDKLDPYKRKTDLDKDLIAVGVCTMLSGAVGGLPVITVILRSTVNVHNYAKTRWSNFYHGILLLLFIFIMAPMIQQVPLCALAILLVFTGFKLASPKVFKHMYQQGAEQLVFFVGTLVITLYSNLLFGLFGGLLLVLLTHFLLANVSPRTFYNMIFNSGSNVMVKKDGSCDFKIKGIANFLSTIKIDGLSKQIPAGANVNVDLSDARLVDISILENLYDFKRVHALSGGTVQINGLEKHVSLTNNKVGLKILTRSAQKMSTREIWLNELALEYGWKFQGAPDEEIDYFERFSFFKSRPIEKQSNCISNKEGDIKLEILDVAFDEGAFMAYDEYDTTLGLIKLPFAIPKFSIEKKAFLDKYLDLSRHKDIDYVLYGDFSREFIVKVDNREEMKAFMTKELRELIETSDIPHLESNGEAILIFNNDLRLARISEYAKIINFAERVKKLLM